MASQIGVYRGAVPDIGQVQAYEQFLGAPAGTTVDFVLAFMADTPSWADFERAALQSTTNGPAGPAAATDWAPLLGQRQLMLAVPACVQKTTWAQEASGVNDGHWAALATTLTNAGLGNCVLRIAREFNGGWYPWSGNPGNKADWVAGYRRIVNTMRNAGFTGKFMWNPFITQGTFASANTGAEAVYPGNDVVDIVGVDVYDGGYPPGAVTRLATAEASAWTLDQNGWDGLTGWLTWAKNNGKLFALPEWGLELWYSGGSYSGGGDNDTFIREMAHWIRHNGIWMHALWEDPGQGVSDKDNHPRRAVAVPLARQAFLDAFSLSH